MQTKAKPRVIPSNLWEQIRASFFEDSNVTIRSLAKRFNIPEGTIRKRSCKEQWRVGRVSGEVSRRSKAVALRPANPVELKTRILSEAAGWLDEIQQLHQSARYSKAESLRKLLPMWTKVVAVIAEQSKDTAAKNAPLISMNVLSGEGFTPRPVVDIDAETGG